MTINYSFFIDVHENGTVWWQLVDAVKLVAGYVPICTDERKQIHILNAPTSHTLDTQRKLIAAKSYDIPNVTKPRLVERDGYQYVEASEFLGWFAQYLAHTKSNLHFPDELARQIEEKIAFCAIESRQEYESLALALKGSFRPRLKNLPENLRLRVDCDLYPLEWDQMTPKQRKIAAIEWDQQHETDVVQDRQFWVNYYLQREPINRQLAKWESISTNSATELAQQETQIAELRQQLRKLDRQKFQHHTNQEQPNNKNTRSHQENTNNEVDRKESKKLKIGSYPDCLPGLPSRQNYWQLVITDAVNKFANEHGRCPNEAEVWNLLCSNTLPEYRITLNEDRGEKSISSSGEKPLGWRSFIARWKRYIATK
ncbi:MAG: hypothetical protein JAY67_12150 [Candidatus Thiodiazotropha taylori]|nr:hypothetical protein [Candidatus Thiodiazotropha taylori]